MKLVYRATKTIDEHSLNRYWWTTQSSPPRGPGSILTFEKPDDVEKPVGYMEYIGDQMVYRPFGMEGNKELYLNPFTNRWE